MKTFEFDGDRRVKRPDRAVYRKRELHRYPQAPRRINVCRDVWQSETAPIRSRRVYDRSSRRKLGPNGRNLSPSESATSSVDFGLKLQTRLRQNALFR